MEILQNIGGVPKGKIKLQFSCPSDYLWVSNKIHIHMSYSTIVTGEGLGTIFPWQMNGTINPKNNIFNSILEDIKFTTNEICLGRRLFI